MTEKNHKRVSIVICTYNGERYLKEQIDSILGQTYPLHEIIIQDDGSTDGTVKIIQNYVQQHGSLIKFFVNQDHSNGVNSNFFGAMSKATGDYIAISDQDDIWEPDKIALQMEKIGDNYLCTCQSKPFSTDGTFVHFDGRKRNLHLLHLLFQSVAEHTMLIDSKLLDIFPQDSEIYHLSLYDTCLGITAAAYNKVTSVNKPLVNHRRHSQAVSYTDFKDHMPSIGNGLHILWNSIKNYHLLKPYAHKNFQARLNLLRQLNAPTPEAKEAERIMELELKTVSQHGVN